MTAGRHRSFDTETALEAAALVFWENGYAGSSLSDLTQAMNIAKPSMYAAFGNKEQLFVTALKHFVTTNLMPTFQLLFVPDQSLAQRLEAHLKALASYFCDTQTPSGCLFSNSIAELGSDKMPPMAIAYITEPNQETRQSLTTFFTHEQTNGTLNTSSSPQALALYLIAINRGMATLARTGITPSELDEMITHVVITIT